MIDYQLRAIKGNFENILGRDICLYNYNDYPEVRKFYNSGLYMYNLENLYCSKENNAKIISLHGINDELAALNDKKAFLDGLPNSHLLVIDDKKIDGEIYKNTSHGLGADFIKLFETIYSQYDLKRNREVDVWDGTEIQSIEYKYKTSLNNDIPDIIRSKR